MEKITSVTGLKDAIRQLEEEQAVKEQVLKDQLFKTYESFKPSRLIGSSLKEIITSPYMIDNVIDTGISLATGYLSRRILVGASGNIIRRVLGTILQVGVTKFVTRHTGNLKSIGKLAFQQILRKKKTKPGKS